MDEARCLHLGTTAFDKPTLVIQPRPALGVQYDALQAGLGRCPHPLLRKANPCAGSDRMLVETGFGIDCASASGNRTVPVPRGRTLQRSLSGIRLKRAWTLRLPHSIGVDHVAATGG